MSARGNILATLALALAAATAHAQTEVPLWPAGATGLRHAQPETVEDKHETGRLDRWISYVSQPTLTFYPAAGEQVKPGPVVLVLPGGGFRYVCIDKEGHEVARWLNAQGISAAVLKYRVVAPDAERSWDTFLPLLALGDAGRAVRLLRTHAADWKVDPARIGLIGFSAGGTMAIRLTIDANDGRPDAPDPVDRQSSRPNNIALVYSTLPDQKLPKVDKQVPFFIVHGASDAKAPVSVAAKLFSAIQKDGGSAELHIYRGADHGFGVQPAEGTVRGWTGAYVDWLRDVGMAPTVAARSAQ